jgi:hypothetical protein
MPVVSDKDKDLIFAGMYITLDALAGILQAARKIEMGSTQSGTVWMLYTDDHSGVTSFFSAPSIHDLMAKAHKEIFKKEPV